MAAPLETWDSIEDLSIITIDELMLRCQYCKHKLDSRDRIPMTVSPCNHCICKPCMQSMIPSRGVLDRCPLCRTKSKFTENLVMKEQVARIEKYQGRKRAERAMDSEKRKTKKETEEADRNKAKELVEELEKKLAALEDDNAQLKKELRAANTREAELQKFHLDIHCVECGISVTLERAYMCVTCGVESKCLEQKRVFGCREKMEMKYLIPSFEKAEEHLHCGNCVLDDHTAEPHKTVNYFQLKMNQLADTNSKADASRLLQLYGEDWDNLVVISQFSHTVFTDMVLAIESETRKKKTWAQYKIFREDVEDTMKRLGESKEKICAHMEKYNDEMQILIAKLMEMTKSSYLFESGKVTDLEAGEEENEKAEISVTEEDQEEQGDSGYDRAEEHDVKSTSSTAPEVAELEKFKQSDDF